MKIRQGFVSNSSSASFVIEKKNLTNFQIIVIKYHLDLITGLMELANEEESKNLYEYCDTGWDIIENNDTISGHTSMDNFPMKEFLSDIGVSSDCVKWFDVIGTGRYGEEAYADCYSPSKKNGKR